MIEHKEFRELIRIAQGCLKGTEHYSDVCFQATRLSEALKYSVCDNRIKAFSDEWLSMSKKMMPGIIPEGTETVTEEEFIDWIEVQLRVLNEEFYIDKNT